jgi:DNA polymerase III delta prime subunit
MYDQIITNTQPAPPNLIIYGEPGVGKTTLAAQAGALLIDTEGGAGAVPGLRRTPHLRTWAEMERWLTAVANQPPDGLGVIAIDTLDWLIAAMQIDVLDRDNTDKGKPKDILLNTLGSAHGGFFKARDIVENLVRRSLFPTLNAIRNRGIAVLMLAHAGHEKINNADGTQTRMTAPDLPAYIMPLFREWADAVMYAHVADGQRVLRTVGTNTVIAKNRYNLPPLIPLAWTEIEAGIALHWSTIKETA